MPPLENGDRLYGEPSVQCWGSLCLEVFRDDDTGHAAKKKEHQALEESPDGRSAGFSVDVLVYALRVIADRLFDFLKERRHVGIG
jgi:hypothetical protein